jgi:protein ImuB
MCVQIPDWPLQRLALARPELAGQTVVLYEATPQGGLKVVAAAAALATGNDTAGLAAGIYPGMPLTEAVALVTAQNSVGNALRGADIHLEPADPDADWLGLEQLAEWCQRFSPIAGLEEAVRPECLLLDVSGIANLFGGELALGKQVTHALAEQGLNVRTAMADTIGAAWAAVHVEFEREPMDFSAGDKNRNEIAAVVHIIPPGETLSALAGLPIGYLRVADDTVALLATLGITRIGQLAALPRSALLSRFGPELLWRFDQAMGDAPETILAHHAPPEYRADFTFEAPMAQRDVIEQVLGELLTQITAPLTQRREGVLRLVCRLKYERAFEEDKLNLGSSLSFSLGLFRPSASPEYLRDLLRLRLESVRMPGPVTSVRVEATVVGPLELRQQAIFDSDTEHERPRRLAGLVDRLSNRLGRNAVMQVMLLPDAQPEYTCVDVPLTRAGKSIGNALRGVPKAPNAIAKPTGPTKRHPPRQASSGRSRQKAKKNLAHVRRYGRLSFAADERPLTLFPQPVRIEVVAAADGAPVKFHWSGRSYAIAYTWGPERIETGWWRTAGRDQEHRKTFIRRDYYRVETANGARFWIFRRREDRQWYMHGQFE